MCRSGVGSACGSASLKICWEADSLKSLICKAEPGFDAEEVDGTGLGHGPTLLRFALGDKAVADCIVLKETQKIKYAVINRKLSLLGPKKIEQGFSAVFTTGKDTTGHWR